MYIQSGTEKVDHYAACEHNLPKLSLNNAFILADVDARNIRK